MPAPLGPTKTKRMPDIQVFGTEESQVTRGAIRFFRERRVVVSFVDLGKRSMAPTELRRFSERLGARALLDETTKAYRDAGLAHLSMTDGEVIERLQRDQRLLRLPLVRHGHEVTAGKAEATWAGWLKPAGAPGGR